VKVELPKQVADQVGRFTGREWLLSKLLHWWDNSDDRVCLLTGDPGTGKSMLLAWLAGVGPEPADPTTQALLARLRGAVKAAYFCQASSRNITPQAFAEATADQLTQSINGFGEVLATTLAERVSIVGTAQAGTAEAGSHQTGVWIGHLDLSSLGDELSFDRAFAQPLKRLFDHGYSDPILLLVDGLDEAQSYTGYTLADLLSRLTDLPSQIRLLATTRDDPRVLTFFRGAQRIDLIADADPNIDDVRAYAEIRLTELATVETARRAYRRAMHLELAFFDAALLPSG